MIAILITLLALTGAAAGYFGSAFGYVALATMLGASNFEGALAMGAFFSVGPIGGVVGAILGVVLAIQIGRRVSAETLKTLTAILAVLTLLAVGLGYNLLA